MPMAKFGDFLASYNSILIYLFFLLDFLWVLMQVTVL